MSRDNRSKRKHRSEERSRPDDEPAAEEKQKEICTSYAMRTFGLNRKEMRTLRHRAVKNPHYATAAPMLLFHLDEVEKLAEAKRRKIDKAREEELEGRLAKLRAHGLDVGVISAALHDYVFGDFAQRIGRKIPKRKISEIKRRYLAVEELHAHSVPRRQDVIEVVMELQASQKASTAAKRRRIEPPVLRLALRDRLETTKRVQHLFRTVAGALRPFLTKRDLGVLDETMPDVSAALRRVRRPGKHRKVDDAVKASVARKLSF